MNIDTVVLSKLGADLTMLAVNGTVSKIDSKIKMIKLEKDMKKLQTLYEEVINELLAEREEAIRIAQIYKNEIEKYEISDKDIEHLRNTFITILDTLSVISENKIDISSFEAFKDIISVDTLKSMQLLGFNYKQAIGQPLTELCANKIGGMISTNKKDNISKKGR